MFRANGGCGYVKKPSFLIEQGPDDEVFDPKKPMPVKKTLMVRYYLKRKPIDFVTYFKLLPCQPIGKSVFGKRVEHRFQ